jgi:uncharacterized protein (TIGR03546 family)
MVRIIFKIVKALNSESNPGQISVAVCFGMITGFTPFFSLHNVLIIFLVLLLRIHISTYIVSIVIYSGIKILAQPIFHLIGLYLLTNNSMLSFWTAVYNVDILRFDKFNNTVVIGGLISGLILFIPIFLLFNVFIKRYRKKVKGIISRFKIIQTFRASKIYQSYTTVARFKGEL